jgi:hypothetical protein
MDVEILVPIAFFAMIAAIVLVPGWLRSREKERLHETLRLAYEKGQPVPPEMIEALQTDKARPAPDRDLRRGVIMLAVAAALVVVGLMFGLTEHGADGHMVWPFIGIAAFPGFIGLGYIGFWLASRNRKAAV